jgi:hypothetical protein
MIWIDRLIMGDKFKIEKNRKVKEIGKLIRWLSDENTRNSKI